MKALALSLAVAVVASTGCGDGDETTAEPTGRTELSVPEGPLPFVEPFDDDSNGWGGPFQRYEGGDYVWDLPSGQRDTRAPDTLIAVEDQLDDLAITTTFAASGIDAISIQCAFEELEGSSRWYDLELARSGASIRKRDLGSTPVETLAANRDSRLNEGRTQLRAECERTSTTYRLALFVDEALVAEASDDEPFGRAGAPNLSVVASPASDARAHTARFEDLSVTQLP